MSDILENFKLFCSKFQEILYWEHLFMQNNS
jgi:hypothetical protein